MDNKMAIATEQYAFIHLYFSPDPAISIVDLESLIFGFGHNVMWNQGRLMACPVASLTFSSHVFNYFGFYLSASICYRF